MRSESGKLPEIGGKSATCGATKFTLTAAVREKMPPRTSRSGRMGQVSGSSNYKDDKEYEAIHQNNVEYNSNGYVSGLIRATQGALTHPQNLPSKNPGKRAPYFPNFNNPVPRMSFMKPKSGQQEPTSVPEGKGL